MQFRQYGVKLGGIVWRSTVYFFAHSLILIEYAVHQGWKELLGFMSLEFGNYWDFNKILG